MDCEDTKITFMGVEIEPHEYEEVEVIHNVCVQILKCRKCGKISIGWYKENDSDE